jgi:hypothetical protein
MSDYIPKFGIDVNYVRRLRKTLSPLLHEVLMSASTSERCETVVLEQSGSIGLETEFSLLSSMRSAYEVEMGEERWVALSRKASLFKREKVKYGWEKGKLQGGRANDSHCLGRKGG